MPANGARCGAEGAGAAEGAGTGATAGRTATPSGMVGCEGRSVTCRDQYRDRDLLGANDNQRGALPL